MPQRLRACGLVSRVHVVPEPLDTVLDPDATPATRRLRASATEDGTTRFVSVFKWERRKGWDLLLWGYWSEFSADDSVELVLRTYRPSWERGTSDIDVEIEAYAAKFAHRAGNSSVQGSARLGRPGAVDSTSCLAAKCVSSMLLLMHLYFRPEARGGDYPWWSPWPWSLQ